MPEPVNLASETPDHQAQEESIRASVMSRLAERDGLGIGFAGAHRTGKTSLCRALAKANPNIPFLETSTSQIAAQVGFDVNNPGDFEDRLSFQEFVLHCYKGLFEAQKTMFFTDRTPLDFAAYLLAEVPTGEIELFTDLRVQSYLKMCMDMMNSHFMSLIVIQPGIPYVPAPGKPAPNVGYQEKLNALIIGVGRSHSKRNFYVLDRDITDQSRRANMMGQLISKDLGNYYGMLSWQTRQ